VYNEHLDNGVDWRKHVADIIKTWVVQTPLNTAGYNLTIH